MKIILVVLLGVAVVSPASAITRQSVVTTTAQRIQSFNYSVETHHVTTPDGYVLTMFRIPYSPKLQNQDKQRPVVFLQHGLLSSSDSWILNGPDNALAYVLADAGYDVWMGNARGTVYSRKNTNRSYLLPSFWDFSWHEIAVIDMPAMIDYSLSQAGERSLHYVGHSQGTTVFFVLMSMIPNYSDKIKTAHMLAPVAYMSNIKNPLAQISANFGKIPSIVSNVGYMVLATNKILSSMMKVACSSVYKSICSNALFLICGSDSKHMNYTLLPYVMETHPAGASTKQLFHYGQEIKSGFFRQYDRGLLGNLRTYGQRTPPNYPVEKIAAPVRMYYSDNDMFSDITDIRKLQERLPNLVEIFHVPIPEWNHLDFLWAMEVKEIIYDRIIAAADNYEQTGAP